MNHHHSNQFFGQLRIIAHGFPDEIVNGANRFNAGETTTRGNEREQLFAPRFLLLTPVVRLSFFQLLSIQPDPKTKEGNRPKVLARYGEKVATAVKTLILRRHTPCGCTPDCQELSDNANRIFIEEHFQGR